MPRKSKVPLKTIQEFEDIISKMTITNVPLELMDIMTIKLKNGSCIKIDVGQLVDSGVELDKIQTQLDGQLDKIQHAIHDVLYEINIEKLVLSVSGITESLFK